MNVEKCGPLNANRKQNVILLSVRLYLNPTNSCHQFKMSWRSGIPANFPNLLRACGSPCVAANK